MSIFMDRQLPGSDNAFYRYAPDPGHPTTLLDSLPPPWRFSLPAPFHFITSQIYTTFTGIVPKPLLPNNLRLIWYLHNGKENMRDYELFQTSVVGENYDILCEHEEVRRVVVMGYSNQNPWTTEAGAMEAELRKMKVETRRARIAQEKSERRGEGVGKTNMGRDGDIKTGILIDVD